MTVPTASRLAMSIRHTQEATEHNDECSRCWAHTWEAGGAGSVGLACVLTILVTAAGAAPALALRTAALVSRPNEYCNCRPTDMAHARLLLTSIQLTPAVECHDASCRPAPWHATMVCTTVGRRRQESVRTATRPNSLPCYCILQWCNSGRWRNCSPRHRSAAGLQVAG